MTHRSVELSRGPSPPLRVHRVQRRCINNRTPHLRASAPQAPVYRGGLPSDHHGSSNGLETFVTTHGSLPAIGDRHLATHLALHRRSLVRSRHPAHRLGVLGHSAVHPQPARRARDSVTCRLASRPARTSGASATAVAAISSSSDTAGTRSRPFLAHVARGTHPSSARTSSSGPCGISMIP